MVARDKRRCCAQAAKSEIQLLGNTSKAAGRGDRAITRHEIYPVGVALTREPEQCMLNRISPTIGTQKHFLATSNGRSA